jgi:hypothetical protein
LGVLICVVSLVVLEKLFEQRSGRILITDDMVEGLNNAFVMVSEEAYVKERADGSWRSPAPDLADLFERLSTYALVMRLGLNLGAMSSASIALFSRFSSR